MCQEGAVREDRVQERAPGIRCRQILGKALKIRVFQRVSLFGPEVPAQRQAFGVAGDG